MKTFDDVVIGAGPGGYVAAIKLARSGHSVLLIEKDAAGGLCLNWGCIPSKILLKDAWVYWRTQKMLSSGRIKGSLAPLFPEWIAHSRERVDTIRSGLEKLIASSGVTLISGTARFASPNELIISRNDGEEHITATHVIIATGSKPKMLKSLPIDGKRIITSREALELPKLPKTLVIVGGGVIGCEMATFFSALGTKVTILEYMPQLLPGVDPDIAKALKKAFEDRDINVQLSTEVTGHKSSAKGITVTTKNGEPVKAELVLSSVGITGQIDELGLDTVGLEAPHGFIPVNPETYETTIPNIFAIGDVISLPERPHPGLAHVASTEGELAAEFISQGKTSWKIDYDNIPLTVFTDPEIGICGLTKEEAEKHFPDHKDGIVIQKTPDTVMGVAPALEETSGLTKIVVDTTEFGKILGAHIIGPAATERIHVWTSVRRAEESARVMAHQVMAHPTFSEVFRETLLALDGDAVHIPLMMQTGRKKAS